MTNKRRFKLIKNSAILSRYILGCFMNYKFLYLFIFLSISLTPINATSNSSSLILNHTPVQVCFSPGGGCTALIVHEIDAAKSEILVQAYSFTSAPIAAALVKAYKRGVIVKVILDKSQKKGGYSSASPPDKEHESAIHHDQASIFR